MPQAKRSTKGSRKFARKNLVFSKTLAALPATCAIARLADEHRDVPGEDDAALLERLPERLPGRVVELGVDVGDHEIHLAHAALGPQALELGERAFRCLRQHRQADQPVGRRLAEVEQPVVVDAIAGGAEHGIVGRDLEDRPEDHLVATPSRSMSARRSSGMAGRRALWS
jgi:hypothetical protein